MGSVAVAAWDELGVERELAPVDGKISASRPRQNSEYSLCTAVTAWTPWARRPREVEAELGGDHHPDQDR